MMTNIFILLMVVLLLAAGLFLLFGVRFTDMFLLFYRPFREKEIQRRKVERITGKKIGFIREQNIQVEQMLIASGNGEQIIQYNMASVIMAAAGFLIGIACNSIPLAIVLPIGLALIPLMVVQSRTSEHGRQLGIALESALSSVTNAYIRSGDFLGAVKESLMILPEPVRGVFQQYVVEVETINPSQIVALRSMRNKIKNQMWHEWCSIVIQCQSNNALRVTLLGVVERLSVIRQFQAEMDTKVKDTTKEYVFIVCAIMICVPLFGLMLPGFWDAITQTLVGQITLAGVLFTVLGTFLWVIKLNKPVTFE